MRGPGPQTSASASRQWQKPPATANSLALHPGPLGRREARLGSAARARLSLPALLTQVVREPGTYCSGKGTLAHERSVQMVSPPRPPHRAGSALTLPLAASYLPRSSMWVPPLPSPWLQPPAFLYPPLNTTGPSYLQQSPLFQFTGACWQTSPSSPTGHPILCLGPAPRLGGGRRASHVTPSARESKDATEVKSGKA